MSWLIRTGSDSGSIVASGTTPLTNQNGIRDVSATGLNSNTTFWLTGVTATATGKLQSQLAQNRSISTLSPAPPPTPTLNSPQPGDVSGFPTSNGISLNVFNPNSVAVTMYADISTNSNVTAETNRGFVGSNNTGSLNFSNLNPNTLYYIAIRFSATFYNSSFVTIQRTTQTALQLAEPILTRNSRTTDSIS
jgi:hypothetical protein